MAEQRAPAARRPSSRRRAPSRAELDVVWAIVGISALAGALSGAEPAGWLPADVLWRAGLAALLPLAAAKAHRWTWLVVAGVAAAVADGVLLVAGASALLTAIAAAVVDRRLRVLGAIVGALSVQVFLRFDLDTAGGSAAIVALAVAPVLVSGYLRCRSRTRRTVRIVVLASLGLAAVATAGLTYAVVRSEAQVREAADGVQEGLDALRDNEPDRAVLLLAGAGAQFEEANRSLSRWGGAARALPFLGHQARALAVVTAEGRTLAETAARATVEADTDELRFDDGVLDLHKLARFAGPLEDAYAALADADAELDEARTMWLVDPLSGAVADFEAEVERALPDAELAMEGVRLAPALFGGEGERRYFVAFTQPAEARGLGGFIGNWAEVTANAGDLELTRSGRIRELIAAPGADQRTLSGPEDYLARYGRFHPAEFLQDLTFSPDGPSVARVMEELYPQAGGQEVDGVIIVDPVALAALMEFTGPIPVEGRAEPLTSENAADFLIREQYLTFQGDEDTRIDFLDEATETTFERLTEGDIPGPRQVADVLGPPARQGRLIVHAVDPDEQALMERMGLDGALPPVDGDFLSVTTQNGGNNKIDVFLERTVDYQATWDPTTGVVDATATVELVNRAPASGLPDIVIGSSDAQDLPLGTNRLYLSLYTPFLLAEGRVNDQRTAMESQRERDRWVYSTYLDLPPGGRATLEFDLEGAIGAGDHYRLDYAPQPLVNADQVRLRLDPKAGWTTTDVAGWELGRHGPAAAFESDEDRVFEIDVAPD